MDSTNLSEIQTTPLNCKNIASNTTPMSCDCCVKNFGHNFSPAQCCKSVPPGVSKNAPPKENFEKLPMQHQFSPGFPFPSPFYYSLFPPNCYMNNPISGREPSRKQSSHELHATPEPEKQNFCQKENNLKNQNLSSEEHIQKNRPDVQFFGNSFFIPQSPESQINFLFNRCSCGDSFPWTCAAFLVPVISYCVPWGSHRLNRSITSSQNICQNTMENPEIAKHSSTNIYKDKESSTINLSPVKECSDNISQIRLTEGKSLENLSQNETASEQTGFEDPKNQHEDFRNVTALADTASVGDEKSTNESIDEFISEYQTNSETNCRKSVSDVCIPISENDSDTELKECLGSKLESHSCSNLKENDSTRVVGVSYSASIVNFPSEEKDSTCDLVQKSSEITTTDSNEALTSKKCIKNYTTSEHFNGCHYQALEHFSSAAGDLGGKDCVGYKVDIQTIEENEKHNILKDTRSDLKVSSQETIIKVSKENDEFSGSSKKNLEENQTKNPKSGIAKLVNPPKVKETKETAIKNETNQKDSTRLRRKHDCLNLEIKSDDRNSSTQKTKSSRTSQHQTQGAAKQQKAENNKRKEEKSIKVKSEQSSRSEKSTKCSSKIPKN